MTSPVSLRFVDGLPALLNPRGWTMSAITSPGPELAAWGARNRVDTWAVPMARAITPLDDLSALAGLVRILRRIRPHIVHAGTPKAGLLGMLAARLAGIDHRIYHVRGLPLATARGLRRPLLWATERVAIAASTDVLSVSPSLRRSLARLLLAPEHRVQVLLEGSGQGVDARGAFDPARLPGGHREAWRRTWGLPPDATVLLFVGRLTVEKGLHELAGAWAELHARHPSSHLVVVGRHDEREAIGARDLQRLRDLPRVHLVGPSSRIADWYGAVDLLVHPSWREGFPNVLLEAASMGLPIVSTRVDGCVDAVVEGETGLLVPARDAAALADALEALLLDPARAQLMGRQGRARTLRSFDRPVVWSALADWYDTLVPPEAP
jgi:glycosyltransferase involved in cell wall biosynthesis